jgi:hypothetical protein
VKALSVPAAGTFSKYAHRPWFQAICRHSTRTH